MTDKVIRIDLEKGHLKTPEKEYWISDKISIDRYIQFELWQTQAVYGVTFDEMHRAWQDVEDSLNKAKFVDAAAIIANMKDAIKKGANKNNHIVLRICSLFLNEKDEDVKTYRPEVSDAKIQDWMDSGVYWGDFFQLLVNLIPGLLTVFEATSNAISEQETKTTNVIDGLMSTLQTSKEKLESSGA